MATITERRAPSVVLLVAIVSLTLACHRDHEHDDHTAATWAVTAWGQHFEVFPEVAPLIVGEPAVAHTHVTRLADFSPLAEGTVEIILTGASGSQSFRAERPVRPGIYEIPVTPPAAGEYDLSFRITTPSASEEIRGGRVRVGTEDAPGGVIRAPAPRGAVGGGAALPFLKEQQWQSDFATDWVRRGLVSQGTSGIATARPPAGGETAITAPVDGVVQPAGNAWPFPGRSVGRGDALFQFVPRIAADVSLPVLQSAVSELESELVASRARLARLEELLELQAVSRRDVEEARARVQTLASRHRAARDDLAAARASRGGGAAGGQTIRAPFSGQVARVSATPGTTVAAGSELARLVRTDAVWLEIAIPPAGARAIATGVEAVVLVDRERPPIRITEGLRLISVAPEIARETGTVTVLVEIPPDAGVPLGSTVEAHVLTGAQTEGIVVPASAVIDDGGVPVVYLQLAGETFVRQEIRILSRQGDALLVDRLVPGQRLVTKGGDAIRRTALMSTGAGEGHVH